MKKTVQRLKYTLDKLVVFQISLSTFMLVFFLLLPVLTIILAARYYSLDLLLQRQYIDLHPAGQFMSITRIGDMLVIKITGKSYGVILNSILNSIVVTFFASILGILVAFVLARYRFRLKNLLRIMAVVPLLMTPFVNAYVIKKIFGPSFGYNTISWFISTLTHTKVKLVFSGLAGVALTQVITFYPIVYLNVYSALMNIDPSMEEQAENLGSRGFRLFRTITLPLSTPGLAAGAALVFIFSLEDVGAPIIFGVRDMLSYHIYNYFQGVRVGVEAPETGALALIMLLIAVAVFTLIRHQVSLRQYAMLSRGGRWMPRERGLGWKGKLAVYLGVFPLVLLTMSPQLGVFALALSNRWTENPFPEGFTLQHLVDIVRVKGVFRGVMNSLVYSLAAVLIILVVGISVSYVVSRVKVKGVGVLDTLSVMPLAIPGLVVAYGYFFFFHRLFANTVLDPLYNPSLPIILAYSVRKLPFTARSIFAGLQQTHVALEEASMNLGASRFRTLVGIVIPLIAINIASGAMISFVYCMSETSVSITLGGLGGDVTSPDHKAPISMVMLDLITSERVESVQLAAALGVLLILIQLTVIIIITIVFKQSYAFIGV